MRSQQKDFKKGFALSTSALLIALVTILPATSSYAAPPNGGVDTPAGVTELPLSVNGMLAIS